MKIVALLLALTSGAVGANPHLAPPPPKGAQGFPNSMILETTGEVNSRPVRSQVLVTVGNSCGPRANRADPDCYDIKQNVDLYTYSVMARGLDGKPVEITRVNSFRKVALGETVKVKTQINYFVVEVDY
jgi:hypothetical protein